MTTTNRPTEPACFTKDSARSVILFLIAGTLIVNALSLIANVMWINQTPMSRKAMLIFDVDQEKSTATWWSVIILALLGGATWLLLQVRRGARFPERLTWLVVAAGFFFLSMDEACMLHERIGGKIDLDGPLTYARWIILWIPLALIAGAFITWNLWKYDRRTLVGLVVGAAIFVSGAVITEIINSSNRYSAIAERRTYLDAHDFEETQPLEFTGKENYAYVIGTAAEEFLEMSGVVFWFAVILRAHTRRLEPAPQAPVE